MSSSPEKTTYLQAVNKTLRAELARDANVIFMGEDIGIAGGAFGAAKGLFEEFGPERIIETPICENSFLGVATGAALLGMRPVVEFMYMDFMALATDQIVNHLAKLHFIYGGQSTVPVTIRATTGGNCRYGASHAQSLEAWYMHAPGLKIAAPSNAHDARWLLQHAIRDDNPWLVVESRKLYKTECEIGEVPDLPVGKARVARPGTDLTLVSYSRMMPECLAVAENLEGQGIAAEVIDLRTINPLDVDTVCASAEKTGRVVVVHEAYRTGGVGAELAARVHERAHAALKQPVFRIGARDTPIPASPVLEDAIVPHRESIEREVLDFFGRS